MASIDTRCTESAVRRCRSLPWPIPAIRCALSHQARGNANNFAIQQRITARKRSTILSAGSKIAVSPAANPAPAKPTSLDTSQDVGNVIFLEHVNLEVPDLEVARLFYAEGLGLTQDPGTLGSQRGGLNVVWYNVGRQQLHICKGPTAQTLHPGGAIGLVLPDVAQLTHRLETVQQYLGDISISHLSPGSVEVRDPYGVTFIIQEPGSEAGPPSPLRRGIAYLLLPCHPGTAQAIAHFYRHTLHAQVMEAGGKVEVVMGAGTKLIFVEQPSLGALSDLSVSQQFSGWHIALYLAQFSACYHHVAEAGLIHNDHPFRDKCHNLGDALRNHQFRFQDIPLTTTQETASQPAGGSAGGGGSSVGGSGGKGGVHAPLAFRLQHEVRSTYHPLFMRCLYNRQGGMFDVPS